MDSAFNWYMLVDYELPTDFYDYISQLLDLLLKNKVYKNKMNENYKLKLILSLE